MKATLDRRRPPCWNLFTGGGGGVRVGVRWGGLEGSGGGVCVWGGSGGGVGWGGWGGWGLEGSRLVGSGGGCCGSWVRRSRHV